MTRDQNRATSGFTLVELLVVIVVLGVLASIVVFAVNGITDRGQTSACAADQTTMTQAEESYNAQHGVYASESTLVSGGLLASQSSLHDITLSGSGYTITNTGTCGISFPTDGFEPPAVTAAATNGFYTVNSGQSLGPWSVVGGSIDVVNNAFWPQPVTASDTQDIDLNGSSYGSIQRSISGLTAGNTYTLTFHYALNYQCAATAGVRTRIGNVDSTLNATNGANTTFKTATYPFTAGSATETLRFDGSGPSPFCGVVLDNISVS